MPWPAWRGSRVPSDMSANTSDMSGDMSAMSAEPTQGRLYCPICGRELFEASIAAPARLVALQADHCGRRIVALMPGGELVVTTGDTGPTLSKLRVKVRSEQ